MNEFKRDCHFCKWGNCLTDDGKVLCHWDADEYYDGEVIEDTITYAKDCKDYEYDNNFPRITYGFTTDLKK